MKKTVIIAIFIIYLASIVVVQLFGMPATVPESGDYVENITITGIEFSNRVEGDTNIYKIPNKENAYGFYFIPSEDEGGYTDTPESLASNPNRIKIIYTLEPVGASKMNLMYVLNNNSIVLIKETDELVFLKKGSVDVEILESKGSDNARDTISIVAR